MVHIRGFEPVSPKGPNVCLTWRPDVDLAAVRDVLEACVHVVAADEEFHTEKMADSHDQHIPSVELSDEFPF